MLVQIGQAGKLGKSTASTSGFSAETIIAIGVNGAERIVHLGAHTSTGIFTNCSRWAESRNAAHYLLTPSYVSGSMDVMNATGSLLSYPEPIEVFTASGGHVYIAKQALTKSLNLINIIQ